MMTSYNNPTPECGQPGCAMRQLGVRHVHGPLRSPSGGSGGRAGEWVRSSPMASSKGLDLAPGLVTLTIIAVLAMAFGFLILVTRAAIHWLRP